MTDCTNVSFTNNVAEGRPLLDAKRSSGLTVDGNRSTAAPEAVPEPWYRRFAMTIAIAILVGALGTILGGLALYYGWGIGGTP